MGIPALSKKFIFSVLFLLPVVFPVGFARADEPGESAWKRIVVIGASASAGFNTRREAGRTVTLAKIVEQMVEVEHEKVLNTSSSLFFMNPRWMGTQAIRSAAKARATLVLAVDFLFWFGYGAKSEERRMEDLEFALKSLSELKCPILLSRIPDMKASVGKMLSVRQVPRPGTLKSLNERIDAWAAEHRNVVMVPMAEFLNDLRAGKSVKVDEISYPEDSLRTLLQRDELHPTLEGMVALTALSFFKLCERHKELSKDDFEMNPQLVKKRVKAAVARSRKKQDKASAGRSAPEAGPESKKKDD